MSDEELYCGFCGEQVRPLRAVSCCGELFHVPCYVAHRDERSTQEHGEETINVDVDV